MQRRSVVALSLLALVAVLIAAPAALAKTFAGSTLVGSANYPAASGRVTLQQNRGVQYFVVEVTNVGQLAGTELNLFVAGVQAGGVMIRPTGDGRRAVPVIPGSPIPQVTAAMPVQLKTRAGVVVVSGTFP
jgi:hypothetical protein